MERSQIKTPLGHHTAALPSLELVKLQHQWLQGARSRLLRAARIQQAGRIVELGCGWGLAARELAQRCNARVLGIDINQHAVNWANNNMPESLRGRLEYQVMDAGQMEVESGSIDIIFTQCSLMWMQSPEAVLRQCHRLLTPAGRLALIEPDYGGLMEYPAEVQTRHIWLSALPQAKADAMLGRKLPRLLYDQLWQADFYLLDHYETSGSKHTAFLRELPLTVEQFVELDHVDHAIAQLGTGQSVSHLPFWLALAKKVNS